MIQGADNNMKRVNILWTGGWDSTYRMIELSRMPVEVLPVYICGDNRKSESLELQSMSIILDMLKDRKETKAKFMPTKIIDKNTIPQNEKVTRAYETIRSTTNLGTQHEWLARYAYENPGLELGTEKGVPETSHIIDAIEQYGQLKEKDNTWVLDRENSTEEGNLVLGNFEFPIIDKYETDMLENIHTWGYEDIMSHIWFCHLPIDGKPCGMCHPCEVKMESAMEFLLPEKARNRYKFKKKMNRFLGKRISDKVTWKIIGFLNKMQRRKKDE